MMAPSSSSSSSQIKSQTTKLPSFKRNSGGSASTQSSSSPKKLDPLAGQLAYSGKGEKIAFVLLATTLSRLRAGSAPKDALAPPITLRSRYTRSYFVQHGGRGASSHTIIERLSVRLNDDVHQHGFYCRFCEDRIPGVPSHFCITSLFPHFSDGGCPVLSALPPSDLDTFLNALRAVDPSTGQELEDERVARELKRQETAIKRTRDHCSDEEDADHDKHQDNSDSGDSEYFDGDYEKQAGAGFHEASASGLPCFKASYSGPASTSGAGHQAEQHSADTLAGQLARVARNYSSTDKYEYQPVKLLSDTLNELRRGVQPKDALTARIAPAASKLRGYVIDLDAMTEADKHATCLNSCNRRAHVYGHYCRLCFKILTPSKVFAFGMMWQHLKSGSCSGLQGADLELFLKAVKDVDKRFYDRINVAHTSDASKMSKKSGKARKKARTSPAISARPDDERAGEEQARQPVASTSTLLPADAPPQQSGPVPNWRQIEMDLTYGDGDDDEDDDDDSGIDYSASFSASFGLDALFGGTKVENTSMGAKPPLVAPHPNPGPPHLHVKEQSPDFDTLLKESVEMLERQTKASGSAASSASPRPLPPQAVQVEAVKKSVSPTPLDVDHIKEEESMLPHDRYLPTPRMSTPPAARPSDHASLPPSLEPYSDLLGAAGVTCAGDLLDLRSLLASRAELDDLLEQVHKNHGHLDPLSTSQKFRLKSVLAAFLSL